MITHLIHLSKKMYVDLALQFRYKPGHRSQYYQSFIDSGSLEDTARMMNRRTGYDYETQTPILFHHISLDEGLYPFLKKLGPPRFKQTTGYGSAMQRVLVYKSLFCGYKVKMVIHAFNDQVLSCTYRFSLSNGESVEHLKAALQHKYGVDTGADEFSITGRGGKKIFFRTHFDAVITYLNTEAIRNVSAHVFGRNEPVSESGRQKQLQKLELAF